MKKIVTLLLVSFPIIVFTQNVGIGTNTPTEKLEVKNPLRSTLKISSSSTTDTTELLLSNKTVNGFGTFYTDFSIKSIKEDGLFFSSLSDFSANASANSLVIRPNGNVGIGTVPSYKFHVNGQSRFNGLTQIDGLNLLELGAGIAGKEANAGKIGYNAFGTNALAIVGAGTTSSNRSVYFFAEGGTTFTGPATILGNTNITGQLQVNGLPGTAGQVLTSNGAADPTWTDASFGNNVRFAVSFIGNMSALPIVSTYTTIYNLSPPDISIGMNSITINKSGLYHIEGYLSVTAGSSTPPTLLFANISMTYDGIIINYADGDPLYITSIVCCTYKRTFHYSQDIYLTAPAVIYPEASIGSNIPIPLRLFDGKITAYLINE